MANGFVRCFRPSGGSSTLLVGCALLVSPALAAEKVSFNRDIRPIMSDTCFHCHGNDAQTREAGLRLDVRDAALQETEGGLVPIVPGDPDSSGIIQRIFDADDPMPPESAHKPLTDAQKDLFRRWVAEGAVYEPHWSYAPLTRPTVPAGHAGTNPIDAFVEARLAEKGLGLSEEAGAHVLERRLALDLTGLPPDAALSGPRPAGDKLVEALLASQHFGERMAVWWLDIARYADTVGFHGDQNQRIFPYRDYVIASFNANKPFDEFTREQLAGDLLPDPTIEQLVATGYNRLNMMTREGGAQPKEYLAKYGAERVRAVAAAWFGSTFGCAECHDHKFDPITSRDFYELQSFFADIKQYGVYNSYGYTREPELQGFDNDHPFPPELEIRSPWLEARYQKTRERLAAKLNAAADRLAADPAALEARELWESQTRDFLQSHPNGWLTVPLSETRVVKNGKLVEKRSVKLISGKDGQAAAGDPPLTKGEAMEISGDLTGISSVAAVRLSLATDLVDDATRSAASGDVISLTLAIHSADGPPRPLRLKVGEANVKRPVYQSGFEVPGIANQWRLPFTIPNDVRPEAVWVIEPIVVAKGDRLVATIGGSGRLPVNVSVSPLGEVEPHKVASPADLAALTVAPSARSADQSASASMLFVLSTAYDKPSFDQAHELSRELARLFGGRTWTLITEATPTPLTVRVLPRGNWLDESGPVVLPATPGFLPGRIESTPSKRLTRLDLANWIVSDANPITARAVMNRLWAVFFGVGLSGAVDDLGSQGELPTHPELLDWLACEFRDSGWDVKHMIRLIVTSRTYRQASSLSANANAVDPVNRLLSSQNPRRLDAEFVRDNALAIAGLLDLSAIGGPSVKPYQPDGYYAALQFPNRTYVADTDERQWRRGVYTHWQRTFLHPMLANFDAPARDECAAARSLSNTPQQALTLLNDPIFVEAARVFASRLLQDPAASGDSDRIKRAFQQSVNRDPLPQEMASLESFLASQRTFFRKSPGEAGKLIAVGLAASAPLDPIEHAAWTQVARVLLNTNEVITRY